MYLCIYRVYEIQLAKLMEIYDSQTLSIQLINRSDQFDQLFN